MKERFSSAWRGEKGRQKEMKGGEKQLEGSVASAASRVYWLRERHFKTQSTFLVSLNGIEAKGAHYSLPSWNSSLISGFYKEKTELYSSVRGAVSGDVDRWKDTEMNVLNWVGFSFLDSLSECAREQQYVYQPGPCDCYIVPPGKRDHQMSIWAFQHFITGLLMLCVAHRHSAPIPLPSVWQCTFYLTVKKCFRDSARSTFVFKCITAVRRCQ